MGYFFLANVIANPERSEGCGNPQLPETAASAYGLLAMTDYFEMPPREDY